VANSKGYIREYTQTYSEIGLKQSKMWPVGTLCITIAANIAKTGILTFGACFPDSIVGFTPNENIKTEFVQFWLSFLQRTLEETAPESAQKNINLEILSYLNMPLPPLPLQQKFARLVEKIESMRQSQNQSKQQIEDLFSALMQKAFRGEI
jgi:type I restriction enzyme S subunit